MAGKLSNAATVRFRTGIAQKKQALQQPQRKLLKQKVNVQITARKNLVKAKRLLNARRGPLLQVRKKAPPNLQFKYLYRNLKKYQFKTNSTFKI